LSLVDNIKSYKLSSSQKNLIVFLGLVLKNVSLDRIHVQMMLSPSEAQKIIERARKFGLLGPDNSVTPVGRSLVYSVRRGRNTPPNKVVESIDSAVKFYYP
jgi:hypothetical protein